MLQSSQLIPVLVQVTLEKVYKLDRDTLLPVRHPDVVAKFTRKLQRLVSEQGAQFISYHADTGEWRFKARGLLLSSFVLSVAVCSSAGGVQVTGPQSGCSGGAFQPIRIPRRDRL
jgi:hypothetical protein